MIAQETLERIVGRAVVDREFLEALLARPEEALAEFGLDAGERARVAEAVRGVDTERALRLAEEFTVHVVTRNAAIGVPFI